MQGICDGFSYHLLFNSHIFILNVIFLEPLLKCLIFEWNGFIILILPELFCMLPKCIMSVNKISN
jgi:hypothetical protein